MDNQHSIKDILSENGIYSGLTMGSSMWPLIHQQKDTIIVKKPVGRLEKYDIPVYIAPSGKYIMHRIIKVEDDRYVIVGDNLLKKEYVTDDMICGILVGFYKNGKKYIDTKTDKIYRFYSKLWVALLPVRPAIIFVHRGFNYINKHLFKRGDKS